MLVVEALVVVVVCTVVVVVWRTVVLGAEVVTDAGVRLGTVTDLIIRAGERGEVVGYAVRREGSKESWFIPRPAQLAVSGDVLLVPNDIEQYGRTDLSSFDEAVTSYRGEGRTT